MCPEFVFALIFNRYALSVSLLTGLPGFAAGRVSKTHIWINCNSFLFYFLVCKNVITRGSSLILAFKFEISAAWLCLDLAGFGLLALRWYLLVTERILFSACSRLAGSGIMVVSCFCRASMACLSALTSFPAVLSSVSVGSVLLAGRSCSVQSGKSGLDGGRNKTTKTEEEKNTWSEKKP